MKKSLIVLALLLVAGIAWGQVHTYFTSDPTLMWDAPPIGDATQTVEWEVWRSQAPIADLDNPEEFIAITPLKEIGLLIPDDDQAHKYAVRTKVTEGGFVGYSRWVWTPFLYATRPPVPSGLRTVVP